MYCNGSTSAGQRRTYWTDHRTVQYLAPHITTVARAPQQQERGITQTVRDMGYVDDCVPNTGNVRALLEVRRDTTAVQAIMWPLFALSKEKVTCGIGLLNLLQFAQDTAQQTNRPKPMVFPKSVSDTLCLNSVWFCCR